MRATRLGLLAALLGLALASGCGGSSKSGAAPAARGSTATAGGSAEAAQLRATIAVASPAILSDRSFAPQYTCTGANTSLPLKWAGVEPATAKELVVSVRSFSSLRHAVNNWTVAGISPSLQQIQAGQLPSGAIVGRNSFGQNGYNLCLAKGAAHMLVAVDVYALPQTVNLKPGFDPEAMFELVKGPAVKWGSTVGTLGGPETEH